MSANNQSFKGNHHQPALFRATNTKRKRTSDDVGKESKRAGDGVRGVGKDRRREGVNVESVDDGRIKEEEGVEGGAGVGVSGEVKDREREGGVKLESVDGVGVRRWEEEEAAGQAGVSIEGKDGISEGDSPVGGKYWNQNSKIFINGHLNGNTFPLNLPFSKQPMNLPINEPERSAEVKRRSHVTDDKRSAHALITEAVHREKMKVWSSHVRPPPKRICQACTCTPVDKPGALNFILNRHPFPLDQGPLVFPLDDHVKKEKISTKEVLENRTVFEHDDTQECFHWISNVTGREAWNETNKFNLMKPKFSVQGPASTKTMGIVYTCNIQKCVVNCPCSVCDDTKESCKLLCRDQICKECNVQCPDHQIQLPRLFNSETDQYTLVTNELGRYKYAIPYAGIPTTCFKCTNDVLEHQTFHLVFHTRCRFCRNELRPFEQKNITTLEDYEYAESILKWGENRTCSYCLVQCKDKIERQKHEETVHKNNGKYKCKYCNKTYSSNTSLNYHESKRHNNGNEVHVYHCELCLSEFTTEASLQRHIETIHQSSTKFECEDCGEAFTREDNLKRHQKEKHLKLNANLDFVEDFGNFLQHNCDQCNKSFKRKDLLQRHMNTVHSNPENKKPFQCPNCVSKFSRKDALKRHVNQKHAE